MKVLLLSFYAPPYNGITAYRAYSLAQCLEENMEVHLVSRHWSGKENSWKEVLEGTGQQDLIRKGNIVQHMLPFQVQKVGKFQRLIDHLKLKISHEIKIDSFLPYLESLHRKERFQAVFVSSPPLSLIQTASTFCSRNQLPLFADFRDLANHYLLKENGGNSFKARFYLLKLGRFLKRNLDRKTFISSVNQSFLSYFSQLGFDNTHLILNGYERSIFKRLINQPTEKFEICLIGTLYQQQDLSILLKGFHQFLEKSAAHKDSSMIKFIGTESIAEIANKIKGELPKKNLLITPKVKRSEALKIAKNASVLFYAGWLGYKGVYSGKMFEYLGLKRPILLAPGDNHVLDELIAKTQSGKVANTPGEVADYLSELFREWKEEGVTKINSKEVEQYSRCAQYQELIQEFLNLKID